MHERAASPGLDAIESRLWMRKGLSKIAGWRLQRGAYGFPIEQKLYDVYVKVTGQTQPAAAD